MREDNTLPISEENLAAVDQPVDGVTLNSTEVQADGEETLAVPEPVELATNPVKPKPRVTIDGVSLDYGNEDLTAAMPAPEEQPTETADSVVRTPDTPGGMSMDQVPAIPGYEAAPIPMQTVQQQPQPYVTPQMNVDANGNFVNPLVAGTPAPAYPNQVPNLYDNYGYDPNATMVDINGNPYGAPKKTNWKFIIAVAVAVIGLAGTVLFFVEYTQTSASLSDAHIQLEDYRSRSETGQRATNQLQDLQDKAREQNEQITKLKSENDSLKKTSDELVKLKAENESLRKDKEELTNKNAALILNSGGDKKSE
ncbi:MAG: hypothetical protein LBC95_00045 [Candidatus Nomurabacteria bacterium]|jgi:hypothetical protein|nr:hypothetical protein [Candidatus Nomurabacteria bacterium]